MSTVSYKRKVIDVRVSQRILWVGAEAYPLHNIARAQTIKLVPKRGPALWSYLKAMVLWIFLGVVAGFVTESSGFDTAPLTDLVAVVVFVLIAVSTVRLITALLRRTLYALVIETAGTPYGAVISTDENLVTQLVRRIMSAINNPQAEFQLQVENFHLGDKIQQFGNHNLGKGEK